MRSAKPRRSLVAAGVVLAVLLFAASAALASRIVRVGPRANGGHVVLHRGDRLIVSLPGNATTGYSWRVRTVNRALVKPLGVTYVPKKVTPPTVGAGGTFVLRFQAIADGTTVLRLVYVQSGNVSARPAKTFALKVFVVAVPT
jgi:inhibitor of cysteine peptidase